MRLTYIPNEPEMATAEDDAIVQRVKDRRGGKLHAIDKTLLYNPQLADGWNSFLKAVRQQTSIPGSVRELVMSRVAVLNQAWYEWDTHSPFLRQTGALTEELIQKLKDQSYDGTGLDGKHKAALKFADAVTLNVIVPEGTFNELKAMFKEQEVVEITATAAAYNCVSRFLVALDVGEMAQKYGVDMS